MGIYEKLNIESIINACGTLTKLGGSLMDPRVFTAMEEAGKSYVDVITFHKKASEYLAELLAVEAACITNGASGAIAVSAAACIAGENRAKILQLPNTTGMKNEIIMIKAHRNLYDQALMLSGATIVEVGYTSFCCSEMIEEAINDKTAMIFYASEASPMRGSLTVEEVASVAKRHSIPLVVDAAAEIPPVENIRAFLTRGANLVMFSGGKEIRGPQASGFIVGERQLIQACMANNSPNYGIGRSMKIDKETIAGLLQAVEIFLEKDYEKQFNLWENQVEYIYNSIKELDYVTSYIGYPREPGVQPANIPRVYFTIEGVTPVDTQELFFRQNPPIYFGVEHGYVAINPQCLEEGEADIIIKAIKSVKVNK